MKLRYRIGRKLLMPHMREVANHYQTMASTIRDTERAKQFYYARLGLDAVMFPDIEWRTKVVQPDDTTVAELTESERPLVNRLTKNRFR